MEHNKEMVIVYNLRFNEVWENPLFIWSVLEPGIRVTIELSLQDSFWDETTIEWLRGSGVDLML